MSDDPRPPLPPDLARESERRIVADLIRMQQNRAQRRKSTVRNIEATRRPFGWDKR